MKQWPHEVMHTSKFDIVRFCVQDEEWQQFRLSLKGVPTEEKLDRLQTWLADHTKEAPNILVLRRTQVQIDNYINALLRGGQLKKKDGKIVVQR